MISLGGSLPTCRGNALQMPGRCLGTRYSVCGFEDNTKGLAGGSG